MIHSTTHRSHDGSRPHLLQIFTKRSASPELARSRVASRISSSGWPNYLWLNTRSKFADQIPLNKASGQRTDLIKIELIFDGLSSDDRARFFELLDYNIAEPEKSKARLVFEASWPAAKRHPDAKRWGGASTGDRAAVPPEVLAQIPVTFLPALRDAEAA